MQWSSTTDREQRRTALEAALAHNLVSEPTAAEPPSPRSRRRLFLGIAFCLATFVVSVQAVRLTKPPPELELAHYAPAGEVGSDTPPVRLAAAPPRQPRS